MPKGCGQLAELSMPRRGLTLGRRCHNEKSVGANPGQAVSAFLGHNGRPRTIGLLCCPIARRVFVIGPVDRDCGSDPDAKPECGAAGPRVPSAARPWSFPPPILGTSLRARTRPRRPSGRRGRGTNGAEDQRSARQFNLTTGGSQSRIETSNNKTYLRRGRSRTELVRQATEKNKEISALLWLLL
jgi:hypothetical protein